MKSILLLCAAAFLSPSAWGEPILTLTPSANISGPPDSLIGWGFTVTNDADYVEITSSQFCLNPVSFPACTLPQQGMFTDYIGPQDIVVGFSGGTDPGSVSQDFSSTLFTGIGGFAVAPSASVSGEDFGEIVLTYNVWDADPNTAPDANELLSDQVLSADATVFVTEPVAPPVPEPASFISAALAVLLFFAWPAVVRRTRSRASPAIQLMD